MHFMHFVIEISKFANSVRTEAPHKPMSGYFPDVGKFFCHNYIANSNGTENPAVEIASSV